MRRPSLAHRWRVLLITSVAVFMAFLDVTVVNVAFPNVERSFPGTDLTDLSWVLNGYNIVFAAALVPAGRLADRLGRKRALTTGLVVFALASLGCGLAPSVAWLVALRVVQATGAAVLVPASLGLLLPAFPEHQRATATGLWAATGAVAAATGPTLGALLVEAGGWRWVFFINVPLGLVALVPARRILRESRETGELPRPDLLGSAGLAAGVALVALAVVKGEDWGWTDARTVGAAVAGLVASGLVVLRSARHAAPVLDLELFRLRSFALGSLGTFVFAAALFAYLLNNVLFLTSIWGYSVLDTGLAVSVGPLIGAAAGALGGRVADRAGERIVAVPGLVLFAVGCGLLAERMGAEPDYVADFLPGTLLTGAGIGLASAGLTGATVAEVPAARFATASAVVSCFRQVGAVLGVAVLVSLLAGVTPLDALATYHRAWWLMLGACVAAGLVAAGISSRPPTTMTLTTKEP